MQFDTEHDGIVADRVAGLSIGIADQAQALQPAAKPLGLFERADEAERGVVHG